MISYFLSSFDFLDKSSIFYFMLGSRIGPKCIAFALRMIIIITITITITIIIIIITIIIIIIIIVTDVKPKIQCYSAAFLETVFV